MLQVSTRNEAVGYCAGGYVLGAFVQPRFPLALGNAQSAIQLF